MAVHSSSSQTVEVTLQTPEGAMVKSIVGNCQAVKFCKHF